jgi:hypothetical protein
MTAVGGVPRLDPLVEDDAHLLKSRSVLRCDAAQVPALQGVFTASLEPLEKGCVFALHVDDEGTVLADAFLVKSEDDVLIDSAREDRAALEARLGNAGIRAQDVSNEWRVFAELPNQPAFEGGPACVRVSDPRRRELGARVYRRAEPRESTAWRHEGRYLAHANKLGIPPRPALLRRFGVEPFEAHLHALGALDAEHVSPEWAARLSGEWRPRRRVLPFRVEPTGLALPNLEGAPLLADGASVGVALTCQGLWGLGLVELAPWRKALAAGVPIRCEGEPVLITWPTWIARESEGRASPAARRSPGGTP